YAAAPAGIVAGLTRVPLVVQEQNAVPGITARLLSRWARRVHVAFPEAVSRLPARARTRTVVSGNPVRAESGLPRAEARAALGLPPAARVLLVVGGSQGSLALNRTVLAAVRAVASGALARPEGLHVLWSTGPKHHEAVSGALLESGTPGWVTALPYLDDMPSALAASDLAVSRAGAMATAELLVCGLPAILVPLPTAAADHQARNAEALAAAGAAVVLPEEGLTGEALWRTVISLVLDEPRMRAMADRARARGLPAAASEVAEDIAALLPEPAA
ncbi:MAG TPA: UDP-N-acetylglucosamine--N-acetylmuramyl-(pentapeptide) pyrophosphoryl-undecaprenol N-acetylglucosamine transferase, partial [Longimicrobiales bacterium]|nr:UDP-N-acetylglucosamine--N-acetylmuramyl-(pentapeptide) pyrophosphoryl-undecaprenol N-acetylglucosamine transferase [Longimicrobiales bacterium]